MPYDINTAELQETWVLATACRSNPASFLFREGDPACALYAERQPARREWQYCII